jgi:class 3 adenylate cyclase
VEGILIAHRRAGGHQGAGLTSLLMGALLPQGTRWTFTASGPVTNLAARLGTFANGGATYVGEATAQSLDGAFVLGELEPQAFRHIREPVVVHEVLGQQTLAEAVFPEAMLSSPV